ncbi:MAG: hypothetical protein M3R24_26060 [Chloroflexota bacterium]|nr:hypothetical protein [Chloroflexota bacterium]
MADDVPSAFEAMHRGRGRTLGTSARSGAPSGAPDRALVPGVRPRPRCVASNAEGTSSATP